MKTKMSENHFILQILSYRKLFAGEFAGRSDDDGIAHFNTKCIFLFLDLLHICVCFFAMCELNNSLLMVLQVSAN